LLPALFFLTLIIYYLTSAGKTPYDYFTRLSYALLHGKFFLSQNPPWLNELIPIASDKFAVVYPPTPAIAALPFVFLFGPNFQQQILAHLMGALTACLWWLIAYKKTKNKKVSFWAFLLAAFGNIVWYLSSNGSAWYLGQVSAHLFLTLTIYESINKKRLLLIIIYFGMAFLSRLQIILALPAIIYLNKKSLIKNKWLLAYAGGISFFILLYGIYNKLRFASFLQTGYGLIPGVSNEPWFEEGIFNLNYIPNHLKIILASFPKLLTHFPYVQPSWSGLAIWITTPAFFYSLFAKGKAVLPFWISIILIALVDFSHGTTGFTQFGYRFAVDFYPLLMFLLVISLTKSKLRWHHWLLLVISVIVNLWGVLWINKFGWVSF